MDVVSLCQDLLRLDTSNPGSTEEAAAAYVHDRLERAGVECEVIEPAPGRCSLVAVHRGTGSDLPPLLVHGHLDVVPATGGGWRHDPFGGVVDDGMLWGRGAVDMKGFVAMMLRCQLELAERALEHERDIVFAYFADEEMGGGNGAAWIAANRPDALHGASDAIGEGGGFRATLGNGTAVYLLTAAERGSLWLRMTASAPAGHAAFGNGANPVVQLAQAIPEIASLRIDDEPPAAASELLRGLARLVGAEPDADDLLDELGTFGTLARAAASTSFTPTVLRAGEKVNVVPQQAEVLVDCRFVPGSRERAMAAVGALGGDLECELVAAMPGLASPPEGNLSEVIAAAVAAFDPAAVVLPYSSPAGTDAQHLAGIGIATYGFAPLPLPPDFDLPPMFHATDERVPVSALTGGYEIFRRIVAAC